MTLSPLQERYRKRMLNVWLFRLFLLFKIPLGWASGMKVIELESDHATTTVAHRWLNQNPFRSMYFAVMAMAAELSTGAIALMAIEGVKPSIASIIVGMDGEFLKRATTRVKFTCADGDKVFGAVEKCMDSGESETVKLRTEGKTADGTIVAVFHFTWSFKQRKT
ncbi:protein of unknown function [Reichenbachiella faecimaris]|uniref:Acyl-coenzyme A thioesterase PaaI, contains HGG motif n=1 Tax=Reichenbachiella faecimaris TaxID=692418 RepID=A0A1W2G919_REIFA|nr:DUF4442 domain-containing protein [Reichenbachiella faecimaris]SMD32994.1 protein of unknown function [Reichenbachiella faecimaris]